MPIGKRGYYCFLCKYLIEIEKKNKTAPTKISPSLAENR